MPVTNSLVLDHFYISLTDQELNFIKDQILEIGGQFTDIKSGDESWQGYYTRSRLSDYFEVLVNRRNGSLGIAFVAVDGSLVATEKILTELPMLDWQTGQREDNAGNPWFDWYSTGDYLNQRTLLNAWIMSYHQRHIDFEQPLKLKIVDCFDLLELDLGLKYETEILKTLSLPFFKYEKISDGYLANIQRKDGGRFYLKINLVSLDCRFVPKKLHLKLLKNNQLENYEIVFHNK